MNTEYIARRLNGGQFYASYRMETYWTNEPDEAYRFNNKKDIIKELKEEVEENYMYEIIEVVITEI